MTEPNDKEVQPEQALVPVMQAPVPVPTFEKLTPVMSLDDAKEQIELVQQFVSQNMVKGEDYYTEMDGYVLRKPSLGKSGAEKLSNWFALSATYIELPEPMWVISMRAAGKEIVYHYYKCMIHHIPTGALITEGFGVCHSEEVQYKYRWFGKDKLTSAQAKEAEKEEYPERRNDSGYVTVRFPNPEIYSEDNKIVKIAKKRANVDAVLTATRASHKFTQDLEDGTGVETGEGAHGEEPARAWPPANVPVFVMANALAQHSDLDVSETELIKLLKENDWKIKVKKSKQGKDIDWFIDCPGMVAKAAQLDDEDRKEEDHEALRNFGDHLLGTKETSDTPLEKSEIPEDPAPYDDVDSIETPQEEQEPPEKAEAEVVEEEPEKEKPAKDVRMATAKQLDWIIYGTDPKKTDLFRRVLKRMNLKIKSTTHKFNVFKCFCAFPETLGRMVAIGEKPGSDKDITLREAQKLIELLKSTDEDATQIESILVDAYNDAPPN